MKLLTAYLVRWRFVPQRKELEDRCLQSAAEHDRGVGAPERISSGRRTERPHDSEIGQLLSEELRDPRQDVGCRRARNAHG
ncbi:hypothetical protein TRAPUB_5534 [Trametes pubescens]|uniref:Uncharacterized protein n=1 Tax=Trametes pubescens TaxID=154538 RepID=A0A1M2V8A0_TRAPU|nr:hypothetical protein TRAPUB_5534 [Trametes pubescens]